VKGDYDCDRALVASCRKGGEGDPTTSGETAIASDRWWGHRGSPCTPTGGCCITEVYSASRARNRRGRAAGGNIRL